jgi:hypothetical protein
MVRPDHPPHHLFAGAGRRPGAREFDAGSEAASEIARLFNSIERSIKAIQGQYKGANVMHRKAA